MSNLQDTQALEARIEPTQVDETAGKVWRQPTLATWEVPEETRKVSGPEPPP
jgi:hypothetical protein